MNALLARLDDLDDWVEKMAAAGSDMPQFTNEVQEGLGCVLSNLHQVFRKRCPVNCSDLAACFLPA